MYKPDNRYTIYSAYNQCWQGGLNYCRQRISILLHG